MTELTAFLDVQSYYFYHRPAADISLPALITLCDSVPHTVHGGFIKLAEQMVDVILKNGGKIHYQIPLSEIVLKNGQTAGLATPQGHLEADAVLLNTEQRRQGTVLCIGLSTLEMLAKVLIEKEVVDRDALTALLAAHEP